MAGACWDAHREGVNCLRFLNDLIYVTASDDTTMKLWDLRNPTASIRTLRGHDRWGSCQLAS